jgi:hypothetical protein
MGRVLFVREAIASVHPIRATVDEPLGVYLVVEGVGGGPTVGECQCIIFGAALSDT